MRSTEPRMARCTMTGVATPSSVMYDSLNLRPRQPPESPGPQDHGAHPHSDGQEHHPVRASAPAIVSQLGHSRGGDNDGARGCLHLKGSWKSSCTVAHWNFLLSASKTVMSILGP